MPLPEKPGLFCVKYSGAADNMSLPDAVSESIDNAIDAGSPSFFSYLTPADEDGLHYLIILDFGEGLEDLYRLFNLGDQLLRRPENKIGLKNAGHMSMVKKFNPESVVYSSKVAKHPRERATLLFRQQKLQVSAW